MNIIERFLSYVGYDTQSDGHSKSCPSTEKQKILGAHLVEEMKLMGLIDVYMDEHGYVYGELEKNIDKHVLTVGLIAHMDTSPDFSGENIKPQMIEDYDGRDIVLDREKNIVMSIEAFPNLVEYKGETLITTDGSTLLGADDKAGIAAILDALETLIREEAPHGTIKVGFTPDEEIGRGADRFDVEGFGADFAYTVDGGEKGEINYENFNATTAEVKINGVNIHPGSAKNKMKNALLIAMELNGMLPSLEIPAATELREGFYHLNDLNGNVENANMVYIIRDHDLGRFEERKKMMLKAVEFINHKYGEQTIELTLTDSYFNMLEKFSGEHMSIIDTALEAMKRSEVEAKILPIRGGTDGARLSYMGLLTPNLFTGGMNFHGKFECIPVESLKKSSEVVQNIIKLIAE
jgi:tripeptide aminopeptidase